MLNGDACIFFLQMIWEIKVMIVKQLNCLKLVVVEKLKNIMVGETTEKVGGGCVGSSQLQSRMASLKVSKLNIWFGSFTASDRCIDMIEKEEEYLLCQPAPPRATDQCHAPSSGRVFWQATMTYAYLA